MVLSMRVGGDAKALEVPLPAERVGGSYVSPLVCLSLGPAESGESSELDNVSLYISTYEHPVHAQSGESFPTLSRCASNLIAVENSPCSVAGHGVKGTDFH